MTVLWLGGVVVLNSGSDKGPKNRKQVSVRRWDQRGCESGLLVEWLSPLGRGTRKPEKCISSEDRKSGDHLQWKASLD